VSTQTVASAAQSDLAFLHQYHQEHPLDLDDDRFVPLHEEFLRKLSTIDTLSDRLNATERANYGDICSRCHKRYLAIKEARANKKLLAIARNGGMSTGGNLGGLGRSAYPLTAGSSAINPTSEPSSSLRTLLDFRGCKNVVMVGSGAFPATLLWLRDNFPTLHYVGLDIDPGCVTMATELVTALGIDNVHFEPIDGRQYNYGSADFVYVANYVVPKRAVLEQIARSTSVRQVVVREPTRGGELLAEAVKFDLPSVFVADAAGAEAGIMMYDILLRRG
jgi:hypothetical protein